MADSFDVDEFLAGLEPRTVVVRVCARRDLIDRHAQLERELEGLVREPSATIEGDPAALTVADQIRRLEAEIEAAHTEFRFKSLGARGWSDLLAQHPPTREQRQASPGIDYNPDTFPVVAVAAASDSPKLTLAQARALESNLTISEWALLWGAALNANVGGDDNPKSLVAGSILRRNERSETTRANEESPDQSSLDE